jgi:hypothetical protein
LLCRSRPPASWMSRPGKAHAGFRWWSLTRCCYWNCRTRLCPSCTPHQSPAQGQGQCHFTHALCRPTRVTASRRQCMRTYHGVARGPDKQVTSSAQSACACAAARRAPRVRCRAAAPSSITFATGASSTGHARGTCTRRNDGVGSNVHRKSAQEQPGNQHKLERTLPQRPVSPTTPPPAPPHPLAWSTTIHSSSRAYRVHTSRRQSACASGFLLTLQTSPQNQSRNGRRRIDQRC